MTSRRPSRLPSDTATYALALAVSAGTVAFLLLGIGALGIVGDGERDWLYLAAPAALLVVAAATRLRPRGMVLALGSAAVATVVAGAVAVVLVVADDTAGSIADVVMLTAMYAALFAVGGWLFSRVRGSGA
ncbi:hypothetical protein [Nocardioides sp. zg-1228]|uniref:hypothetical protein n=1 Tax=Nocardioides sp. zg-1228 TaxID=2763008 RepID=UPI001642B62B|nr:hypothetical protein [Nocardioides sp. zg-1228]MBC2932640.1 hypothetical protein [Nocardioides sp. zg-1228]QSF58125.1 hypothetical protein JX575_02600 [Nocardioides sp. zg-1228]